LSRSSTQTVSSAQLSDRVISYRLGFWSAVITTAGGILYFLVLLGAMLTGGFVFPPAEWLQLFGGITSLLFCPLIVVLVACLQDVTPANKKSLSLASLGFTLLFALSVSINRFTQLGALRHSLAAGSLEGIEWFLPYGDHSMMLGLEMMGWGWFLGLAMLFAAPIFSGGGMEHWLRGLMILYGLMGLTSAAAYLFNSPISLIGFAAWGLVLYLITGLLAVHFRREEGRA
jgi:hypothetical protein